MYVALLSKASFLPLIRLTHRWQWDTMQGAGLAISVLLPKDM